MSGYRYDTETGLYYLNSRYYNPEWGRFINADALVGQTGLLLSHNMFAYCNNNPVSKFDIGGFMECAGTAGTADANDAVLSAYKYGPIVSLIKEMAVSAGKTKAVDELKSAAKSLSKTQEVDIRTGKYVSKSVKNDIKGISPYIEIPGSQLAKAFGNTLEGVCVISNLYDDLCYSSNKKELGEMIAYDIGSIAFERATIDIPYVGPGISFGFAMSSDRIKRTIFKY